jgi:hypothetical protein
LAKNPNAGDVIAGAGGCRKVRWSMSDTGKSGGVRVIYFNRLAQVRMLQRWGQGRKQPSGAARTLIKNALIQPVVLRKLAA